MSKRTHFKRRGCLEVISKRVYEPSALVPLAPLPADSGCFPMLFRPKMRRMEGPV